MLQPRRGKAGGDPEPMIPKSVSGGDQTTTEVAVASDRLVLEHVVSVKSARAAETTKLTENTAAAHGGCLLPQLHGCPIFGNYRAVRVHHHEPDLPRDGELIENANHVRVVSLRDWRAVRRLSGRCSWWGVTSIIQLNEGDSRVHDLETGEVVCTWHNEHPLEEIGAVVPSDSADRFIGIAWATGSNDFSVSSTGCSTPGIPNPGEHRIHALAIQ